MATFAALYVIQPNIYMPGTFYADSDIVVSHKSQQRQRVAFNAFHSYEFMPHARTHTLAHILQTCQKPKGLNLGTGDTDRHGANE